MKMRKLSPYLFALLLTGLAAQALAHHGTSVNYDDSKVETIKGTVTRFVWRNPHSALLLDVTSDSGEVTSHAIELPSPASMSQTRGWTRRTFAPGDVIEIKVNPSKAGNDVSVNAGCDQGGCDVVINGELLRRSVPDAE